MGNLVVIVSRLAALIFLRGLCLSMIGVISAIIKIEIILNYIF